jgi:hypothetical protein
MVMSKCSELTALFGPSSITIHNNCHMLGQFFKFDAFVYGHYKLKNAPKGDANVLY